MTERRSGGSEFIERDFGRRSPWNLKPLNINGGNLTAEERRKQNRDRIASEKDTPMSSLGRVNEQIEQQQGLGSKRFRPMRGTRGHGRKINYKQP